MKFYGIPEIPVVTALPSGKVGGMVVFNSTLYLYTTAWTAVGGITPAAGSSTQIQVNNNGAFMGDADLTWDTSTNTFGLGGTDTGVLITATTTEPSTVPTNSIRFYTKLIAGRGVLKWKDATGLDTPVGPPQWANGYSLIAPSASTTIQTIGCAITTVGTISTPTLLSTSLRGQMRRFTNTSAATAGSLASLRVNATECYAGNASGYGGYFMVARFGLSGTLVSGERAFVGLTDTPATAPTNVDPTTATTPGRIGMAINANSGNWSLVNNVSGTAPTVLNLGTNFPVNNVDQLELILHCAPNATVVSYRVTNHTSNLMITGNLTTNLPSSTTFLGRVMWACNNAATTAVAIDCTRLYLETDY